MARKSAIHTADKTNTVEASAISDYVRLCVDKGVEPEEAFKEVRRKLKAAKLPKVEADI